MRTAETLREGVRNFRFTWEDRVFRLGASIGVVPITADNEDVASILSAADSACGAAKEGGRNRVHSFAENDIELMRRRREMQWAARINAALEEGRFELYRMAIQPLQRVEVGAHYELLLRLKDEGGRIVAPNDFIAAAERYGITPAIDRWVIENAFRWLVSDSDERENLFQCSINLSGQSLGDDKFLPFVIDQFHRSGLDGSKICFEITETAAVASFSQANRFIQALKELGCKFALDDFGTGLSSFGYLKHFPVDYLKIDGSFVKEILHDPIDREMVRSINEIGHLTGKQTIAEFAENQEIINMLQSLGVDYAQGYGVSQPRGGVRRAGGQRGTQLPAGSPDPTARILEPVDTRCRGYGRVLDSGFCTVRSCGPARKAWGEGEPEGNCFPRCLRAPPPPRPCEPVDTPPCRNPKSSTRSASTGRRRGRAW